jgi:hypothetical protein
MDDTEMNTEKPNESLPQTPPILEISPTPMAHGLLNVVKPPPVLEPHVFMDRSHPTHPNRPPDIWKDDTEMDTEKPNESLPQPPPILEVSPTPMAHGLLNVVKPLPALEPHVFMDRSHPNGSPDIWINGKWKNTETNYKNSPQITPILNKLPPLTCEIQIINQLTCMLNQHSPPDRSESLNTRMNNMTPPNQSESLNTWMNNMEINNRKEWEKPSQTPTQLNDPIMTITHRLMRKNQPPCLLQPHSYNIPYHTYPYHIKPNHTNTLNILPNHTTPSKNTQSQTQINTPSHFEMTKKQKLLITNPTWMPSPQMADDDSDDGMDSPSMNILQGIIAGKEQLMSKAKTYAIILWMDEESKQRLQGKDGERTRNANKVTNLTHTCFSLTHTSNSHMPLTHTCLSPTLTPHSHLHLTHTCLSLTHTSHSHMPLTHTCLSLTHASHSHIPLTHTDLSPC